MDIDLQDGRPFERSRLYFLVQATGADLERTHLLGAWKSGDLSLSDREKRRRVFCSSDVHLRHTGVVTQSNVHHTEALVVAKHPSQCPAWSGQWLEADKGRRWPPPGGDERELAAIGSDIQHRA